ncbi:MAG: hypothetical protein AAF570_19140, partial [Bacteroidota bacterium]
TMPILGAAQVQWGDISAYQYGSQLILEWETLSETNMNRFEIYPVPNFVFTALHTEQAVGNSTNPTTYSISISAAGLMTGGTFCGEIHAIPNGGGWQNSDTFCIFITVDTTSIWPGDANSDGAANVTDLLYVGIANGTSGTARTSTSINWAPFSCPAWPDTFANGINYRYADCDGNGTINLADTLAIAQNYGLTHNKTENVSTSGVPLTLVYPDSVNGGDTVTVDVMLGDAQNPVSNAYGLSFTLEYDSSQVDSGTAAFTLQSSWLGTPGTDLVSMHRDHFEAEQMEIGVTRLNQQPMSGYGKVAEITIVMVDNIAKTNFDAPLRIRAAHPLLIDHMAARIDVQTATSVAPSPAPFEAELHLWPNPASQQAEFSASASLNQIVLMDLAGRTLQAWPGDLRRLDLAHFPRGLFLLRFEFEEGAVVKRLRLQ